METYTRRGKPASSLGARQALGRQAGNDRGGRVLIVDDDTAVRLLCAVSLAAEGLHVLEAVDGLDGLEQARSERPDLVLTDVAMPGLDGFELAGRLRRDVQTRRIPVVFLSGEIGHAQAERARALGALAYLTKPFDPRAVAEFVARALEEVRARSSELIAEAANQPPTDPTLNFAA